MRKECFMMLIILTCISCENRNQLELAFENHLPKNDQILLEDIVNSYDHLIETAYNGDAYEFFSQIESERPLPKGFNKSAYCELVNRFDKSTLAFKSQNIKYDTVYLSEQGNIITKEQPEDITENGLALDEEITILPPGGTIEEEIEKIKKRGYWRFISASSFRTALEKVSNEHADIQAYIDKKEAVGYINPQIMASSVVKHKMDAENYFIKRIIAIELFLYQIRKTYRC